MVYDNPHHGSHLLGILVDPVFTLGASMKSLVKLVLIAILFSENPAWAASKPCDTKLVECRVVISDLYVEINLLERKAEVLTMQRDELATLVEAPRVSPLVWVLAGALAGSLLTIYFK